MKTLASFAFVSSLFVIACSAPPKPPAGAPAPGTPPTTGGSTAREPAPATGDASHTACTVDGDCVVVETACCDHCNGGKAEAFHKDHAAAHTPTGCESTMCTKMACGAVTASCQAGRCVATQQPL